MNSSLIICLAHEEITSTGLWFKEDPLNASLPLLMLQFALIVSISRALHLALRHLGQPLLISQMLAGIILGPSVLGRFQILKSVFAEKSWTILRIAIVIGMSFFFFIIGVKTDITMLRRPGKKATIIIISSMVTPLVLSNGARYLLRHSVPKHFHQNELIKQIALMWCVSSYTNLTWILHELNLLNSKISRLAMSATLLGDTVHIVLRAIITALSLAIEEHTTALSVGSIVSFLCLLGFIGFIARPICMHIIRKTPEGMLLNQSQFLIILTLCLACAFLSQVIGLPANVGIVLFGLTLPSGPPLGSTLTERLEGLINGLFVPMFMASAGLRMNATAINDVRSWGYVQLFLVLAVVGKFIGAVAPFLFWKMPLRDAITVGIMVNSKSIYEFDTLSIWQEKEIIDGLSQAVIVLTVMIWTAIATPLLKTLCKPSMTYVAPKRRGIQFTKRGSELRILACIHNQENVSPLINLLEASHPTKENPISVYVLQLVHLVGRMAAVLVPLKKGKKFSNAASDHINNAFNQFEQQNPSGSITVHPFLSMSPYATMHDDVCTLALDKKASLVIVPFHKVVAIDGTLESVNQSIQLVNIKVLGHAPCSVGIFVDHGLSKLTLSGHMKHNIAVYFLGGPDDREALAFAMRTADNPWVGLTVVRFRTPENWRNNDEEEEKLDEEMVEEFQVIIASREDRVVFHEEVIWDGEGMVSVIRRMSTGFSLLVVGRRSGSKSPLTSALSGWSECPELGIIGDMLASTDFGNKVATLVVQQQARVGRSQADNTRCHPELPARSRDIEEGLAQNHIRK